MLFTSFNQGSASLDKQCKTTFFHRMQRLNIGTKTVPHFIFWFRKVNTYWCHLQVFALALPAISDSTVLHSPCVSFHYSVSFSLMAEIIHRKKCHITSNTCVCGTPCHWWIHFESQGHNTVI